MHVFNQNLIALLPYQIKQLKPILLNDCKVIRFEFSAMMDRSKLLLR